MNSEKEKSLKQIIRFRKEKLDHLLSLGINPYPHFFQISHQSSQVIEEYGNLEGKSVSVAGRIVSLRRMGKVSFFHLQDELGRIQIYIKQDHVGDKTYSIFKLLDIGDIVGIEGTVFTTKMGEITILTTALTLLSKSIRPLPGTKEKEGTLFHAFTDKEQRYRHRYIDLIMNPDVKDIYRKRAKIVQATRLFLDTERFLEVETPVLQPLYGGAFARPFKTEHLTLNQELYLRISDELYLKRLIVGGFDRVYELSKVFRNEGMDRNHNPEFTMLEFYMAYVDYIFLMDFTENLIRKVAESVGVSRIKSGQETIDLTQPYRRSSYMDLLSEAVNTDISAMNEDELKSVCRQRGIELEDNVHLGRIYDCMMRELVEPELILPTFIIDYPKVISPLAKVKRENNSSLVERFELFIGGFELANAFSELNDPVDQRERLEAQSILRDKGYFEAQTLDEDFLHAIEIGMPPTGGVGIGIDRLVMLLTGQRSIKDVIFFPAMRPRTND